MKSRKLIHTAFLLNFLYCFHMCAISWNEVKTKFFQALSDKHASYESVAQHIATSVIDYIKEELFKNHQDYYQKAYVPQKKIPILKYFLTFEDIGIIPQLTKEIQKMHIFEDFANHYLTATDAITKINDTFKKAFQKQMSKSEEMIQRQATWIIENFKKDPTLDNWINSIENFIQKYEILTDKVLKEEKKGASIINIINARGEKLQKKLEAIKQSTFNFYNQFTMAIETYDNFDSWINIRRLGTAIANKNNLDIRGFISSEQLHLVVKLMLEKLNESVVEPKKETAQTFALWTRGSIDYIQEKFMEDMSTILQCPSEKTDVEISDPPIPAVTPNLALIKFPQTEIDPSKHLSTTTALLTAVGIGAAATFGAPAAGVAVAGGAAWWGIQRLVKNAAQEADPFNEKEIEEKFYTPPGSEDEE